MQSFWDLEHPHLQALLSNHGLSFGQSLDIVLHLQEQLSTSKVGKLVGQSEAVFGQPQEHVYGLKTGSASVQSVTDL